MSTLPTRRQAQLHIVFVAVTSLVCAGLLTVATLVPAPPAVLPALIIAAIGMPMLATLDLPTALAVLRATRRPRVEPLHEGEIDALLLRLEALPEVEHPLDF